MSFPLALAVVALSGFVSLSYEILWFRIFSFATGGDPSTFGRVLAAFLIGLAQGAAVSRRFVVAPRDAGGPRQLRVVAGAVAAATLGAYLVVPGTAWLAAHAVWQAGFLLVVGAAFMLGMVLPVVSHLGIAPDDAVGARLSYLYLANIVGSALGSLITGFVLTDRWPIATIARTLAVAGLALAGAVAIAAEWHASVRDAERRPLRATGVAVGLVAGIVLVLATARPLFHTLYERLLYKRDAAAQPAFAEVVETRGGVVAVTRDATVYGGGAYDGVIATDLVDDRNLLVRAYALAAMHSRPARILQIGVGTAAWTHVLARLPGVEHITAVEINAGYLPIIARHRAVSGVLADPRVEIVIDDGRRWMARHPEEKFDAIVMNTTWYWRAHTTNLVSAEFMALARAHLRPGGILYFNTTWSPDVMKTALATFPYALRCVNFMAVSDAPIAFDGARWSALLRGMRRDDGRPMFDPGDARAAASLEAMLALPSSLAGEPDPYGLEARASLLHRTARAHVVTDDNMWVEWRAPRPVDGGPPADEGAGGRTPASR